MSEALYIDPVLYTEKPSGKGRLEREMETYELLEKLSIPYVRVDHEVTPSIDDCQEVDRILGVEICKNLFLCNQQKTMFYLLLMPGHKKFMTKDLSKQIGSSRLSFAGPEYMEELLGIAPGSVTVLGLMNDKEHRVKLLIDKEVLDSKALGCHPCINTSSLKVKTKDILEKFLGYTGHEYMVVEL